MSLKRAVVRIKPLTGRRRVFESLWEAEANGFKSANIYKCIRGEIKLYKGYKWEYLK